MPLLTKNLIFITQISVINYYILININWQHKIAYIPFSFYRPGRSKIPQRIQHIQMAIYNNVS